MMNTQKNDLDNLNEIKPNYLSNNMLVLYNSKTEHDLSWYEQIGKGLGSTPEFIDLSCRDIDSIDEKLLGDRMVVFVDGRSIGKMQGSLIEYIENKSEKAVDQLNYIELDNLVKSTDGKTIEEKVGKIVDSCKSKNNGCGPLLYYANDFFVSTINYTQEILRMGYDWYSSYRFFDGKICTDNRSHLKPSHVAITVRKLEVMKRLEKKA
jgi:hypothetical protein